MKARSGTVRGAGGWEAERSGGGRARGLGADPGAGIAAWGASSDTPLGPRSPQVLARPPPILRPTGVP